MGILKDKVIVLMLLIGIIVRFILTPLMGYKFDVDTWFAWAIRLNEVGFANFYSDQMWTNYTPGFLYILGFLGFIKNLFSIDNSFYFFLKLPSILAEILLAAFAYQQISKKSLRWAKIAAILILFNPAFIFNSSIWGQIDGLLSLSFVFSVYFLEKKKIILSSIFLGLSFLIKPQAIALFPIFLLFLIKNFSIKNFLQLTLPALLTVFFLSFPFFINNPFGGIIRLFSRMASDYPHTSLFAYNFWGRIGFWIPDNQSWTNLTYQTWGQLLFLSYWITVGYFYFTKKLSFYNLAALAVLGFFFLPTRVHERYLLPAIIFLILTAAIKKSKLLVGLIVVLSILHFLNLYYVYIYYNFFYLKLPAVIYNPTLYHLLDTGGENLSLISTIIFILISITIIKNNAASKQT